MMRAPRFWQNPTETPGLLARLLAPLGGLYGWATARHIASGAGYVADCPVICVGNINVGGTGKTPTVIALIEMLGGRGAQVVSRGYGGSEIGPVQVDERQHRASEVGDEPLLISAFAPVWVAKDRGAGVRSAEKAGAEIILLDDGFQNPTVAKSLSIVVVDAEAGFGNGLVLPAGPLREPVEAGLARADLVLSIGDDKAQARFSRTWGAAITVPRANAHFEVLQTGMDWGGAELLAFAGIGRPEKFFQSLRQLGAEVLRTEILDDHQPLTEALMARLDAEAQGLSAQLVTTEKDAVRLPARFRQKVLTLPVRLVFDEVAALDEALAGFL